MELKNYLSIIEKFIADYLQKAHSKCYILGLSGGVDSSLVAALTKKAVGKDKLFALIIPIESNPNDEIDAIKVAKALDINYEILDLSKPYFAILEEFKKLNIELDTSTKGNLKVRMRMSALYALAQKKSGLVIGTDNKDERYVGYFTKYGDGGVDLLPIAHLVKHEVVEAAKILGVPTFLAERVPSAGLFENQTDETEMGVSYKDLDDFLIGKEINEDAKKRIQHLHKISEHKREEIPSPIDFDRE